MPTSAPSNKILTGDCIAAMQDWIGLDVKLAFADPPFNIGFEYDGSFDDNLPAKEYLEWSGQWMRHVYRMLHPVGSFWLAIGDAFVSELDVLAKSIGFHKRSQVVWYYTFGVNSKKKFTPSHTQLLYYTMHKTDYTFNVDDLKVKSAREAVYGDKRAKAGGRLPDDTWILQPQAMGPGAFSPEGDTWQVPRIAGTFKQRVADAPNQMPEHILGRIIRGCSLQNDLVLDPFSGTGTTAAVAKKLERRYIGIELSPTYAERSRMRLKGIKAGDSLEGNVPQGG